MNDKTNSTDRLFYKEIAEPCVGCQPENLNKPVFSHQLQLVKMNNNVNLTALPYVILQEQTEKCAGETNDIAKSERIYTEKQEEIAFLVGKLAAAWQRRQGSLGSLKKTKERTITLKTDLDFPTHQHAYTNGYDYITVVSARTAPWDEHFVRSVARGDGGKESKGNQYRFINSGLRQLRLFPRSTVKTQGDHAVQRILIVFQQGYTQKDIERINEYSKKLNAYIKYVKDVDEFIQVLNQRKEKQRFIKKLVIFAHGVINHTTFHYQGENVDAGLFGHKEIEKIEECIFDYDACVTTYACRNGISVDKAVFFMSNGYAGAKESPAQKMADCWDVNVKAYEMRSSYAGIYGYNREVTAASNYGAVIERYENECNEYEARIANGESVSPPQKPTNYDEMVLRHNDWETREENKDNGGGPIMPNGAWRDPSTGDSPIGLKTGLQDYKPQEWTI